MSQRVVVVTDSTASLPPGTAEQHGLVVVPLQVVVGDQALDEGSGATAADVAEALRAGDTVTTSRPAPEAFAAAYEQAAARGADAVVSVHLSAEVSGTYESALLAAGGTAVDVTVVDTGQVGLGTGYAALAAAVVASAGGDAGRVARAARERAGAARAYFYVDTLEHLRRGGRVGAAQALLGTALAVKPLLTVTDGRVEPLEKVRTSARAIARLEELALAVADGAERGVDVAVQHLDAEGRAEEVDGRLRERLPADATVWVREISAVVGVHVGPGMVAVTVAPRVDEHVG